MPQISQSALVLFSAEQMYQLVNNIDSYPNFIPGCIGSRVIKSFNNEMIAAIDIKKAGIIKTFTTRNTLIDNKSIKMQLVNGPFHKFFGAWQFIPFSTKTCRVELYLYFEFTNTLMELVFGGVFKDLACNMVQAFSEQAKQVYSV